ncbi:hypothetical protein [Pectinatus frisingensis]|uniref:hypothetical protein n=1 Tax=Pectinatus frisingensis TaxID=865 RepID=UPI0018C58037|nr:hypothetical protein [Pectinatus frisingensis]
MGIGVITKARALARKAQQLLYDGKCTVYEHKKTRNTITHETTGEEIPVHINIPCRLSFNSSPATDKTQTVDTLSQNIKLFISPDIIIKAGSKIDVKQNNNTTVYKNSGQPAIYATHQEINLELYKEHP